MYENGNFREAHIAYTEALEVDPLNHATNSNILHNRALVNTKLGYFQDAIADCTNALSKNSSNLKGLILRGKCQNHVKNFKEAVKDLEATWKLEKTDEIWDLLNEAKAGLNGRNWKNYYKILGIGRHASDDEIKKAYKKQALVHHPDKQANKSDEEKREHEKNFKEVGEAYAILSDPCKKKRFDIDGI